MIAMSVSVTLRRPMTVVRRQHDILRIQERVDPLKCV